MILLCNNFIYKTFVCICQAFFRLFILGNYYKYINFYKKDLKVANCNLYLVHYANFSNAYVKNSYTCITLVIEVATPNVTISPICMILPPTIKRIQLFCPMVKK